MIKLKGENLVDMNGAVQPAAGVPDARFVNVLMHGAFGYVFDLDCIWAYTPACFGHTYNAGTHNIMGNVALKQGTDYELTGVKKCGVCSCPPDKTTSPVLSLKEVRVKTEQIDQWHKRYTKIKLPYPSPRSSSNRPTLMCGALYAYVGEIFSGVLAADPLNSMTMYPSMQILVYEPEPGQQVVLKPLGGGDSGIAATEVSSTAHDTLNFHIFCTKDPMMGAEMEEMGMTPEGHIRRAFAALVDLFGPLELQTNFPNGFHPAVPSASDSPALPVGVGQGDLEPSGPIDLSVGQTAPNGGELEPMWGHVNCGYTDIVFLP